MQALNPNPPLSMVSKTIRYPLQAINYTVFMLVVWYFSVSPPVQLREENEAVITIAFAHAGQLLEPCRKLTQAELAELALNMRVAEDCPRERSPVALKASLEGTVIYEDSLEPPGLYGDGGVDVYFSSRISAGKHTLEIEMDDSARDKGVNHHLRQQIEISPGKILLVGFEQEHGFVIK